MRTRRIRPHERRPLPNGMLVDRIASSWKLILLTALFAAGMAFGAVSVKYSANHEWLEQLLQLLQEYSTIRNSQSLFSTMCNSLFSNLIYLSVAFIAHVSEFYSYCWLVPLWQMHCLQKRSPASFIFELAFSPFADAKDSLRQLISSGRP